MQHAQGNFTPEQLIVAGRRAEAQGQPAYALQFYRYIADNYGNTTEAYEARDAIYRLSPPEAQPQTYPPQQQPTAQQPDHRPVPTLEAGPGPSHGRPLSRKTETRSKRKAAAQATEPETDETALDADVAGSGYRIGRIVAAMLGTMGWLMFLSAIAMAPIVFAALTVKSMPKGLREGIASNLMAVGSATFGMLFLGLMAIFAAQAARATFDTADAVRHLLYGAPRR